MSRGGGKPGSASLTEFLSEAQEFVESLSRSLMAVDAALRDGEPDPDLINEVFRGWHTLKGLSATFGVDALAQLAHLEESLLDDVRLGRVELTPELLDSLLESVETVMRALAAIEDTGDVAAVEELAEIQERLAERDRATQEPAPEPEDQEPAEIDPATVVGQEVLEVLTEFEEHRLVTNLKRGHAIYRARAQVELMSIDSELESIKERLKPLGEIITYLPSSEGNDPDLLDIDVLLALQSSYEELAEVGAALRVKLELLVPVRSEEEVGTPTLIPPPPGGQPGAGAAGGRAERPLPAEALVAPGLEVEASVTREQAVSLRSVSQSVRVDIGKLDRLMNTVGELNLVRSAIYKVSDELRSLVGRRELAIELHRVTRGFERKLAELREGILEVRMVPVGQMFDRLARMTRKFSRELGKEIHLVVSGGDTEVDKLIIEELSDPLMHIIRNAVDHGIEQPSERTVAGKPEMGTVALTAYQKGNHVLFEIEDDGAGIDGERILEIAVARGLVELEQAEGMSPREILNLIFMPGITTSTQATAISGRGVGMDVVKTNISGLGGVVEVQSELGIGTKFTITMPVTLAIIPALLVLVDENTYAIPLNTVAEALFVEDADVRRVMGAETISLRGQTLRVCRLDGFFGRPRPGPIPPDSRVVVAALGQRRIGLVVDALVGQQDVVIKPLGPSLDSARCFAGATDIGDQRLSLVLDTAAVIDEFLSTGEGTQRLAALPERA